MTDAPPNRRDGLAISDRWIIQASCLAADADRSEIRNIDGVEQARVPGDRATQLVTITFDSSPAGLAFTSVLPPRAAVQALSAIVASIAAQVSEHEGEQF